MQREKLLFIRESLVRSVLATSQEQEPQAKKATRSELAVQASRKRGLNVESDSYFYRVRCMHEEQGMSINRIASELNAEKNRINYIVRYCTRSHIVPGLWKPPAEELQ